MKGRAAAGSFFGLLTGPVQKARLAAVAPFLAGVREPVLDIGCGLTELPGQVRTYAGCDRNPDVLAEMRRRFPDALFLEWDVAESDPPPAIRSAGPFATILMVALLEHLRHPATALRKVAPLLRAGGRILVTTPHPAGRFPLEAGAALGLLSSHAAEEHERLLSRKDLNTAAGQAGLEIVLYRRFLLGFNQLAVLGTKNSR